MTDTVPPNQMALREALGLSEDILKNVELSEIPLANIALKASRLARLLNDFENQKIFEYEASGYPTTPSGVSADVYRLGVFAEREYKQKKYKSGEFNQRFKVRLAIVALELSQPLISK